MLDYNITQPMALANNINDLALRHGQ